MICPSMILIQFTADQSDEKKVLTSAQTTIGGVRTAD